MPADSWTSSSVVAPDFSQKPSSMEPRMTRRQIFNPDRRSVIGLGLGAALIASLPATPAAAQNSARVNTPDEEDTTMGTVKTKDNVEIFYKDWGP
jgi:non-heme chloroperoxidase